MSLTPDKIRELLASADAPNKACSGSSKWFDGNEWQYGTLPPVGSYSGKAGSPRRYLNTGGVVAYKA